MADKILSSLTKEFLIRSKIKIDYEELEFQLQSHSSYPSLFAITDVLTFFKIQNAAIQVPPSKESLSQFPEVFMALVQDKGEYLALVTKKNDKFYIKHAEKSFHLTEDSFLRIWNGVAIAVEKSDDIINYNTTDTKTFKYILLAIVVGFVLYTANDLMFSIFLITNFIGLFIGLLIVRYEMGDASEAVDKFCSGNDSKQSCDEVLTSAGSTLLGFIKLSDATILYFLGLLISGFLISINNGNIGMMYAIPLLGLPFTIYSLFYQAFVLKAWCRLCLTIVSILWLQSIFFFMKGADAFTLQLDIFSIELVAFGLVIGWLLWMVLKSRFQSQRELKLLKVDHYHFKRNFDLFNASLSREAPLSTKLDIPELIFGPKESPLEIVIITNPRCVHCREVHRIVEQLIDVSKDKVRLVIRFNLNTAKPEDMAVRSALRLMEIYDLHDEVQCLEAMHDLYLNGPTEQWFNTWHEVSDSARYLGILEKEHNWCKTHKISFTPEILINGISFPNEYDRKDILFFIDDLHDEGLKEANPEYALA